MLHAPTATQCVGISDTPPPLQDDPEEGEGDQDEADAAAAAAEEVSRSLFVCLYDMRVFFLCLLFVFCFDAVEVFMFVALLNNNPE